MLFVFSNDGFFGSSGREIKEHIKKIINDSINDVLTKSSYFKNMLNSVNDARTKLIVFIALAFSHEYNNPQSELNTILRLNLPDDQDYLEFIKKLASSDQTDALLYSRDSAFYPDPPPEKDIIDVLSNFLKNATQYTANKLKAKQPVPGYQLIDETIEKLQLFKSMCHATSIELLSDTKNLIRGNKLSNFTTPFWKNSLQPKKLLADDKSEVITIKATL